MAHNGREVTATEQLTMSDQGWQLAVHRHRVISELALKQPASRALITEASDQLGVSPRQIYVLLERYRKGTGLVTDLISHRSNGGRGKSRLPEPVEQIIRETILKRYLTRQKRSVAVIHREISRLCARQGFKPPARNTVASRIAQMNPIDVERRRGGPDSVRSLKSAGGQPPPVDSILEQVQIDHTVIDLIIVDEHERRPIGRPYLTLAIDVYSRCVLGMVVTLEPPSAVSVGLCLAHAAQDKRPWLQQRGLDLDWPMSGKPVSLYVDNAREFKSEALIRGCQQHGIDIGYRPPGQPHYGGIVERVIGTAMSEIHDLPGTTFSNTVQRGSYDSEKHAALTLAELEKWMILAVATYHGTVHHTLGQTPASRWDTGVAATQRPPVLTSSTGFLVDFLPVYRRALTRTGFVVDHVHYFSNALKPWISRRESMQRFIIRRDPRDISRIWVLDPSGGSYLEVPYRTLSHPPLTLWEHRQAVARLREQGQEQVDEQAVFQMAEHMRDIAETAEKTTKSVRRQRQRRRDAALSVRPQVTPRTPPADRPVVCPPGQRESSETLDPHAERFEEIEPW